MKRKRGAVASRRRKETPSGVKIISVIDIILSVLYVVLGVSSILVYFWESLKKHLEANYIGAAISPEMVIGVGIFALIFGVLTFVIAYYLKRGKNWARILRVIIAIILVLTYIANYLIYGFDLTTPVSLIYNALVIWYLLFNKSARSFF